MVILEFLAPVFAIIALGSLLNRVGLMPVELISGVNQLLYWVGLPIVVFYSLAVAEPSPGDASLLITVLLLATVLTVVAAWLWARLVRVPPAGRGTFVQAAFRGNLAYIGLPLLLTVPGVPRAPAVLAMMPMLIAYNVLAVFLLFGSRHEGGLRIWRPVLRELVRNPIIIASVAGALWHHFGWVLPGPLDRTLGTLAEMALPLALLCIGAALMTVPLRGNRRVATMAALFKVAVSPLIGYGLGRLVGLDNPAMLAALLYLACPAGATTYTMVKQIGGDEAVAASSVVISSVLAAPALALVLALFAG